jgi:hypothetical protein
MKTTRVILGLLLLGLLGTHLAAQTAEPVALHGILISASNAPRDTDRRLAPYEPVLRRILRFTSYHFLGDDRTTLTAGKKDELLLGDGNELALDTERIDEQGVHIRAHWMQGGRTLMKTGLVLPRGSPAVLGGPVADKKGEVYAIILIAK